MQRNNLQTLKLFGFTSKVNTSVKPQKTASIGVEFESPARLITLGVGGWNSEGGDKSYHK